MTAALSAADKALIAQASQANVVRYTANANSYLTSDNKWLGTNNIYRADPVAQLKQEKKRHQGPKHEHLGEYIAASALVHCWDGWTYLGRALNAHGTGVPTIARHLGYYAELRGAMSLMATEGIGVFDDYHFVVSASGTAAPLDRRSTHDAVWLYLEEWANAGGTQSIGEVITPESVDLVDWIQAIPGQPAWKPLGTDWLLRLGLDLKRLALDRDARNGASYRPSAFTASGVPSPVKAADFIIGFMRCLEPQVPAAFNTLDLHFLRRTNESAFRSLTNSSPLQAPVKFLQTVRAAMAAFDITYDRRVPLESFLLRKVEPDDCTIIRLAEQEDMPSQPTHHMQVMSRAAILLRLATGSVARLFRTAGVSLQSSEWWWTIEGLNRGLWETRPDIEDLVDLWLDIDQGIAGLREWIDDAQNPSYRSLSDLHSKSLMRSTALEALALIGLAS